MRFVVTDEQGFFEIKGKQTNDQFWKKESIGPNWKKDDQPHNFSAQK